MKIGKGKKKGGKISYLDWTEANELFNKGNKKDSLFFLLRRAYGFTNEEIYALSKEDADEYLANIEGGLIKQKIICSRCGTEVQQILCEDCAGASKTVQALVGQMKADVLKEMSGNVS